MCFHPKLGVQCDFQDLEAFLWVDLLPLEVKGAASVRAGVWYDSTVTCIPALRNSSLSEAES
jgi:hypothetical protein